MILGYGYDTYNAKKPKDFVTYGNAITAIMESNMLSSHKIELIQYIDRDESPDYYEAIISIMKSDMFDSNKIKAIKAIQRRDV